MLYQTFIIILLLLVVGSFTSCKTVREVKSIESKGISDPLSDRFIGSSVSKYESGVRHSMDGKRTTTKKIFALKMLRGCQKQINLLSELTN